MRPERQNGYRLCPGQFTGRAAPTNPSLTASRFTLHDAADPALAVKITSLSDILCRFAPSDLSLFNVVVRICTFLLQNAMSGRKREV
ncbi:hypothetical protein LA635_1396 [Erwinia amylovora LA635]|nr:hypothetical protein EAM01S_02_01750 [Erwinia amylovora NBRC 12687 = CFBP 1232]CDK15020.1 hypothetical protein LA635_1396 [Erwinia amylovora LA635]CDK18388.1 hypothetical protein LA636_1396 [Erwinia amylovora LA636]CDK21757.1 hypothetical protein LA637_1397 [Erwinia amylovora LA637]